MTSISILFLQYRRIIKPAPIVRNGVVVCTLLLLNLTWTLTGLAAENPPAAPDHGSVLAKLSNGDLLLFGINEAFRWNPVSGATSHTPVVNVRFDSATDLGNGLLFVGGTTDGEHPSDTATWLSNAGTSSVAQLHVARTYPRLLKLSDNSVLALGGNAKREPADRGDSASNAVDLITLKDGLLQNTALPDIPATPAYGRAIVNLVNGEVLVAGGGSGWGCSGCTTATYILNVEKREWRAGPEMHEARSFASASLLPDGSVMVAGGWTNEHDWSNGPTRTVERLDASQRSFTADTPMLAGMAMQYAGAMPGAEKKQLLLAGGTTAAIQTYDISNHHWSMAGETGGTYNRQAVAPFLFHDIPYIWFFYSGTSPGHLFAFRSETSTDAMRTESDADQRGSAPFRDGETMVAATQTLPALFIGGTVDGNPSHTESAAVYAVWPNGTWRSLAGLPAPISNASAFRLAEGSIVVVSKTSGEMQRIDEKGLFNNGNWVNLGSAGTDLAGIGQCANGELLFMSNRGALMRLTFPPDVNTKPAFNKTGLPNLNRPRVDAVIRGLPDGRIIVAGGAMQDQKIALMTGESNRPNAQDIYVSVGEYMPAHRYEIFDPISGSWKSSVPSRSAGGTEVILDDGSVIKLGLITVKNTEAAKDKSAYREKQETILEHSRPDGSGWSKLEAGAPPSIVPGTAKLLAIDGEVYLTGFQFPDLTRVYNPRIRILQWYNSATRTWETLWESNPDDTRSVHRERIIMRTLTNGKKVVLPVEPQ